MSHKSRRIAEMVAAFQGRDLDARYLGYFVCFNQERFYEAHDVLEDLWLLDRRGPDGDFYKALIQLAGAFVHLQKGRLGPSIALLRLARGYLGRYPECHHQLNLAAVVKLTLEWEDCIKGVHAGRQTTGRWEFPKLGLSDPAREC